MSSGERGIDLRRIGSEGEAHPDRWALVVGVLDFGFGERGAVADAPVHRLETFVDVALIEEIDKRASDHGLILGAHREVWIFPAAEDAEALEIGPLDIDVLLGVLAAGAADLARGHLRFLGTEFAIHLDFDGQAVAIPAGDVGRIETGHGARLDHEILEDFIERGTEVDAAVGVRRPVVQHVERPAGARRANLMIKLLAFPALERLRLGLR